VTSRESQLVAPPGGYTEQKRLVRASVWRVSRTEHATSPPGPAEREHGAPRSKDARLVLVTLAGAASLAAGVLVALSGAMDAASLLLVTGGLVVAACLHRLGRSGPERD